MKGAEPRVCGSAFALTTRMLSASPRSQDVENPSEPNQVTLDTGRPARAAPVAGCSG